MNITDRLRQLDPSLIAKPYDRGTGRPLYKWFDIVDDVRFSHPEGIEAEVGEFLHGLVRMLKPELILETGTRVAISTRYMAMGLKDNGFGQIVTIERDPACMAYAVEKIKACVLEQQVREAFTGESLSYDPSMQTFDMLYLDSEPEYRYQELVKFYPYLAHGGMIVIHDMGRLDCSRFAPIPDLVKDLIEARDLHAMAFPTCAGLTIFQKAWVNDYQKGFQP